MTTRAVVTVREALSRARRGIKALGSEEAGLEAELLLMHVLGTDRAHLYQRLMQPLDGGSEAAFERLVGRRLSHEPVPYITGHREFFGYELEVAPAALIPRPETETLTEAVIAFARGRYGKVTIADVGTGTGAIAVALALEFPHARIVGTDISAAALELAARNVVRHGLSGHIDLRPGNLLAPLSEPVDVIAANPPYVTTEQWKAMPPEIREHEPRLALDGGPDGLNVIRRLLAEAPGYLSAGGALFCEIGDSQGEAVLGIAADSFVGAQVEVLKDLGGRDRVLAVYTSLTGMTRRT